MSVKGRVPEAFDVEIHVHVPMETIMIKQHDPKTYPVACPHCDWLGCVDQAGDESRCTECGTTVSPLRQKGLDSLRAHHRQLLKIGYKVEWTLEQRAAEQERVERFFQRIGQPLRSDQPRDRD